MELSTVIKTIKQDIKDTSEQITDFRKERTEAKAWGRTCRDELLKHLNQVHMGAIPEQPRRGELERDIRAAHYRCSTKNSSKLALRPYARDLQLAYAFLRGKAYKDIERSCKVMPEVDRIWSMMDPGSMAKVDPAIHKAYVEQWLKGTFLLARPEREPKTLSEAVGV